MTTTEIIPQVLSSNGTCTGPEEITRTIVDKIAQQTKRAGKRGAALIRTVVVGVANAMNEGAAIHNRQKLMAENFYQSNAFHLRTVI